jgi:hypothetical protein
MKFRRRPGLRGLAGVTTFVALVVLPFAGSSALAVSGAAFTTDNPGTTAACLNGPPGHTSPAVNCNIYDAKADVWINGGPSGGQNDLSNGTYFFAVLVPGGQPDPNDGGLKNLSDTNPLGGIDDSLGDAYTDRTFSIVDGHVSGYAGPHAYDNTSGGDLGELIQLWPYDTTSNPGGVYILAICSLDSSYPVNPRQCKYDAFKVKESETNPASGLSVTKTAAGSLDRTFPWTIEKSADKTEVHQSGSDATFHYTITVTKGTSSDGDWQVGGTITVFNPNVDVNNDPVPVDHVTVTDAVDNGGGSDCTVTDGNDVTISGSFQDFAYNCTYSSEPALSGMNTATVHWDEQTLSTGPLVDGSDTFSVDFTLAPNVANDCITVSDNLAGPLGQACATGTFSYDYTFHNQPAGTCTSNDNTAVIDQTNQSASETVSVCVGADLTAAKDATPAFTRRYNWTINKAVDRTRVELLNGSATFNYTVTVTQTGVTDSGWGLTGTITVSNPNDFEAVTVNITDAVGLVNCTVTGGTNVSVPASGSVTATYSCTLSSGASGTNTATVTWNKTTASTPNGSATGIAPFSFTTPTTTINKTITVTDSYAGALGTATATDPPALATSRSFPYARIIPAPATGCVNYPNTARIIETNQTSSRTVAVCRVPPQTGALTMGFWKNKNGQNIIKADAAPGGVCNLATWLRGYAPFQDLSSTASCLAVATYVTNVINAANCSGSSCNPMLKAQMLATALDVYFSTLLNNKIGAASPIGDRNIDLTVICQMIDGSSGSTCSGTYYNVSSAFGNPPPSCLTVSAMLTYAASQSNLGGSFWYGQIKATQVKAKDAFDSINNVVAFQC